MEYPGRATHWINLVYLSKGYSRNLAQRDWRHALIMSERQASEIFIMNLTSRFGDSKSEGVKSHHNFWKFNSPPCLGS